MRQIKKRILVIDDEAIILKVIKLELEEEGYLVDIANDGFEGYEKIKNNTYDLVILDNQMPRKTGAEVLMEIKRNYPKMLVIMMTAYGSIDNAVEAMKLGAYDYLTKPFENSEIITKINQAFLVNERLSVNHAPEEGSTSIIGCSKSVQAIRIKINKIKDLDSTVLLTGDSGTGKGVIAREIHNLSKRSERPFIHVNCAVLPANLIESELFGHVKGSFTGATDDKKGKFEQADNGTIFLDEIGTLDHSLQAKLLTVLQEKKYEKIGSEAMLPMKARIITATNRNLEEAVSRRVFREDLYYRLNVIRIECPNLRYRKDDIEMLTLHFIEKYNSSMDKNIKEISQDVMNILMNYKWPGNVRELENTIESAIALSDDNTLRVEDLPIRIQKTGDGSANTINKDENLLEIKEMKAIEEALKRNNRHRENTANELGISRRTLQYKIKKFGLI